MKTAMNYLNQIAAAGLALAALTAAPLAHAVVTTCTGSGGTNCLSVIPDGPRSGGTSTITMPDVCAGGTASAVTVHVSLTHSWVGDVSISLSNPAASVTLLNQVSGDPAISCQGDDLDATFADGGSSAVCQSNIVPSVGGTLAPAAGSMASLATAVPGAWTLTVTDHSHGNNGAINDWAVDVTCGALPPADMNAVLSGFPAAPAPNSTANGTVTCNSLGGQAATNVTCAVAGGTESACTLQPANTAIASFPVASVPVGSSITCAVAAPVSALGAFSVTATTSADTDANPANNTATVTVGGSAPADMAVTLTGFPTTAAASAAVAGTLTCTNIGSGVAATAVNCGVTGATASTCTLQPANTAVASFPVAAVPAGSSVVCAVSGTMPVAGPLVIAGTTSATNDSNAANNAASAVVAAIGGGQGGEPLVTIPFLSMSMQMLLLALLLGFGVRASLGRKRSDS
jgi:subtilisin-like proprotein convertase family protein